MTKTAQEQTKIMKILSNANRLKLLEVIGDSNVDLCVNQLADKIGISQSLASHQLAHLASHGVVEGYRTGQTICYKNTKTVFAQKVFEVVQFLLHNT